MMTHELRRESSSCGPHKYNNGVPKLQRKASTERVPEAVPPIVSQVLASPGHPLDAATRKQFEPRFGVDFGSVRIHDDSPAGESARAVSANAYTVGRDIVFAQGQYEPHGTRGVRLLAHELTHVAQQRGESASLPTEIGSESDPSEHEARSSEAGFGHHINNITTTNGLARQPQPKKNDLLIPQKNLKTVEPTKSDSSIAQIDLRVAEMIMARVQDGQKRIEAIWEAIDVPDKYSLGIRDEIWKLIPERLRDFRKNHPSTKQKLPEAISDVIDLAEHEALDHEIEKLIELLSSGKLAGLGVGLIVGMFTDVTELDRATTNEWQMFVMAQRRPEFISAIDRAIKKVLGIEDKPKTDQDVMQESVLKVLRPLGARDNTEYRGAFR